MRQVTVVGAVIRDADGRVFCARRGPAISMGGMWEFPGGKIEPGEDPRAALEREMMEEFAVRVSVGEQIADAVHDYPALRVRLITFVCAVVDGVLTPNEHDQVAWVPVGELLTLPWAPADLPTVNALRAGAP